MNDLLRAILLGLIEGFTEFLPISSTGHMILAMPVLGVDPAGLPWKSFLYFIQIGAILAVIVFFRRRLWTEIVRRTDRGWKHHLLTKLFVAMLPAAAVGLPLNDWVEERLEWPVPVAIALILGAVVMELIERRCRRNPPPPTGPQDPADWHDPRSLTESITLGQAAWIGLAQVVSIIPGTSRAMATIMGGMLAGVPVVAAVEFSFYLAIPTLLGAGMLKLLKYAPELDGGHAAILVVGFATAFGTALLVIQAFLRFVQSRRLRPFAVYRVVLGAIVLGWWALAG